MLDEFGVDPVQVASRKSDEERGEYSAHGLRFAINRGERPGWDIDIDQTDTYVGSDFQSISSEGDADNALSRVLGQPGFLEGSSRRPKEEFVEGSSRSMV